MTAEFRPSGQFEVITGPGKALSDADVLSGITGLHDDVRRVISTHLGAPYTYTHGPDALPRIDPTEEGINCQALLHLVSPTLFGATIPPEIKSAEIFAGLTYFDPVAIGQPHDLPPRHVVLFGRLGETDPRNFHIAVSLGNSTAYGNQPALVHAAYRHGVTIWPYGRFREYRRYEAVYGWRKFAG